MWKIWNFRSAFFLHSLFHYSFFSTLLLESLAFSLFPFRHFVFPFLFHSFHIFCWLLLLWRSPWLGDPGCQRSLLCSGPEQPLGPLGCLSDSWLMAATVWPSRRGGLSYQAQPGMWDRLCCEGEPGLCPRLSLQVHWFCSCLPTWCSSGLGVFMLFGAATAERMLRLYKFIIQWCFWEWGVEWRSCQVFVSWCPHFLLWVMHHWQGGQHRLLQRHAARGSVMLLQQEDMKYECGKASGSHHLQKGHLRLPDSAVIPCASLQTVAQTAPRWEAKSQVSCSPPFNWFGGHGPRR